MAHGHSTIFTLKWDGGSQPVLIREVQVEPVRQDMLHIDFFAPNMTVKLRQSVSVSLHGAAEEIEADAVLQHVLNEIEVEALPSDLPNEIIVDVSGLAHIGDSLHVRDIDAPENVTILTDPDTTVASVIHMAVEREPTEEEEGAEIEGEGAAEGEAAEE